MSLSRAKPISKAFQNVKNFKNPIDTYISEKLKAL
jgi:hypothetical protein